MVRTGAIVSKNERSDSEKKLDRLLASVSELM